MGATMFCHLLILNSQKDQSDVKTEQMNAAAAAAVGPLTLTVAAATSLSYGAPAMAALTTPSACHLVYIPLRRQGCSGQHSTAQHRLLGQ